MIPSIETFDGINYVSLKSLEDCSMDMNNLKREYDSIIPIAKGFVENIVIQIQELIASKSIATGVPLEYRIKEWDKIQEKIERNKLHLSTITDLEDLIGVRIILLFIRDLDTICSLISETFIVYSTF